MTPLHLQREHHLKSSVNICLTGDIGIARERRLLTTTIRGFIFGDHKILIRRRREREKWNFCINSITTDYLADVDVQRGC